MVISCKISETLVENAFCEPKKNGTFHVSPARLPQPLPVSGRGRLMAPVLGLGRLFDLGAFNPLFEQW
jgi:hypothetical protein